jgi:fructokinase
MLRNKVFAFGEVLFDEYENYKTLGGAPFNYTYHLNKLSVKTYLISRVGDDEDGNLILSSMRKNSIPINFVQVDPNRKTGKVRVKLGKDKTPEFKILRDRAYDYIEYDQDMMHNLTDSASLFYFGTLAQRSPTSRNTLNTLLRKDIKYFYDVNIRQKFYTKELLINSLIVANVVKMNIDELRILNVLLYNGGSLDLNKSTYKLFADFNLDLLSITLGGDGALLLTHNEKSIYREESADIVNTVGAGDAYSAILSIGYLAGWSVNKINKTASMFAADICGIRGAVPEDDGFYDKYRVIINET